MTLTEIAIYGLSLDGFETEELTEDSYESYETELTIIETGEIENE